MSTKARVGIVGGAGYTAGELIRLLNHHPQTEISFVQSSSNAHKPVSSVHADLYGETDLTFTHEVGEADVLFICRGHGESKKFLEEHALNGEKVIDLSHDFRLQRPGNHFVYGLPEVYGKDIQEARLVANPGCFATCIQLGLLPLAASHEINQPVHISAITGSTGAGQKPSATTHYSWRNNNISVYKAFQHQHLAEIRQTLQYLQPDLRADLNFLPFRGNFTRGIYATLYLDTDWSLEKAQKVYQDYYATHPFVYVIDEEPNLKMVVNTNKCFIHLAKVDGKLLVLSMIDNLLKGASGQAIQNMNLMLGIDQTTGLQLKASFF